MPRSRKQKPKQKQTPQPAPKPAAPTASTSTPTPTPTPTPTSPATTPSAASTLIDANDLWLLGEGRHRRLWECLGAHPQRRDGVDGTLFSVWAPNAQSVSVVGDFNDWDAAAHVATDVGTGVQAVFIAAVGPGTLYKYEVRGADDVTRLKTDPFGITTEAAPGNASIVQAPSAFGWSDGDWMQTQASRDPVTNPLSIYEVHLGSWIRSSAESGQRSLSYREIAPRLADHVESLGFTHIELLPIMEHPFGGSWGYQVTGFFAPTSRYGTPDDLRFLIDTLHRRGIGVILDWVPAHFPGDEHGLGRFDGTALYEHEDPRRGLHPDWDTLIFNYGRHEVDAFLLSSALYWLEEFHIDGLRVDAVASMLYLDYSRGEGEWLPNKHGGRENLEAIAFLKQLNQAVAETLPGRIVIAEESTEWPGVTKPVSEGGLGFTFKWNMGWMHDTLAYFREDPIHRGWHIDKLTFAQLYEHGEHFMMPISHDECVHGKGSLLSRMPGDEWQQFANLRLLLAYQFTRPSKQLLFMGTELAPRREWDHDISLDWDLAQDPLRGALHRFMCALGHLYKGQRCFWDGDRDASSFEWVDCSDRENSVFSYLRFSGDWKEHLLVVLNMTPIPREGYRIGVPAESGAYEVILCSDDKHFGGSDVEISRRHEVQAVSQHGRPASIELLLPPLGAMILAPVGP